MIRGAGLRLCAVLGSLMVFICVAQVLGSDSNRQESPAFKIPPTVELADGSLEFFDGSLQATAARDNPTPPCFDATHRFVDCGNGTVTDTATGLIWLEDLSCLPAALDYASASELVAGLSESDCLGLTDASRPGDWRLPTAVEWRQIVLASCPDAPPDDPKMVGNGSPSSGCYKDNPWATGVSDSAVYWASNTSFQPDFGLGAYMDSGLVQNKPKNQDARIWPVRGDGRPVP